MPELRIRDVPGAPGQGRRVEVTWQDGLSRQVAVTEIDTQADRRDRELVRWYLEEYAEYPADPAPALAASAEGLLVRDGMELFRQVFSGPDAAGIWALARDRLGEVRVGVDAEPGEGLAWELLRDPERDAVVALEVEAFVRTHLRAAVHPDLPEPSGDRLRVLLAICRPGGREDVPFRSVASRLVRGGAERMEGLDLDVLRPATFARLSQVLRAAKAAGRPYHVVHFDGHGTYLDVAEFGLYADGNGGGGRADLLPFGHEVSVVGPVRPGQHGYLLFEAPGGAGSPGGAKGVELVDGPALGGLLAEAGVPVLVLNACRSAYAEARSQPNEAGPHNEEAGHGPGDQAAEDDMLTGDAHARIRAYGSLAAEVAVAGVPGVVAMRYNVYVGTATQFVTDLYAHLLAGSSLGEAATAARRGLAADPDRQIAAVAVTLQDWVVPMVYESAPLVLLNSGIRSVQPIRVTGAETGLHEEAERGLPRPPDAGFFGRDETLLALDRTFDSKQLVLLHAFAGAGKSSTAAEFARWYQATGGLNDPQLGRGPMLWSSFEHHLTADRVIAMAGDHFAGLLEANGIAWAAITDPRRQRHIVLQILKQIPVLWIWDNVEPVTGFPAGTPSAWTAAEQEDLAGLLSTLAQRTRCKVLLTSRRAERGWLGAQPARVRLPAMPMRESLQLAAAIAARRGQSIAGADWRPLLRFAAGNPLTITVVSGQALCENLITAGQIAGFAQRLQAGDAQPEAGQDAALGRSRSLAASLDYGFEHAFTEAERAQLALLHLFRDTVNVNVLRNMGQPVVCREDVVPELARLDRGQAIVLLERAADIGLLTSCGSYYQIHPALPWYFTVLFTTAYGGIHEPAAQRATRAYARSIGDYGNYLFNQTESGHTDQAIILGAEEANLLHGMDCARADGLWEAVIGCMQGLYLLYTRTGRDSEWSRLVADVTPDVTDSVTGGPLPGREEDWATVTGYRTFLAIGARDWPAATELQSALVAWSRDQAAAALAAPAADLTADQERKVRRLAVDLCALGEVLRQQDDPGCLPHFREALTLDQRIADRQAEVRDAGSLGLAYMLTGSRDLEQAERWFLHSLSLTPESDHLSRSTSFQSLADIAMQRFEEALDAREPRSVLLRHITDALRGCQEALEMTPADDHELRGLRENNIGNVYRRLGDTSQALRHYHRSIQHSEACGDVYAAGRARYSVAILFEDHGRVSEALRYVRAALDNWRLAGPGAAADAALAEEFIAELEQRGR